MVIASDYQEKKIVLWALFALVLCTWNSVFGSPIFYAEGVVKTYALNRQGFIDLHTEAGVELLVSKNEYYIKNTFRTRAGTGPTSTQIANDGRSLFQVIEWSPSLLKRFKQGGLHDNTHIVTVQDTHANPRGLMLSEFISWCAFGTHVSKKELRVVPNIFPEIASGVVSVSNVVRKGAFEMPSSLEIVRVDLDNPKVEVQHLPVGANFRVLSLTNIGKYALPTKIKMEVWSSDTNVIPRVVVDQAELVIAKWEEKKFADINFSPIIPTNTTIVDERSGRVGQNIHEFGDVGWGFLNYDVRNTKPVKNTYNQILFWPAILITVPSLILLIHYLRTQKL